MYIAQLKTTLLAVAGSLLLAAAAGAVPVFTGVGADGRLQLSDAGVVGIIDGSGGNPTVETGYAQTLLNIAGLGVNTTIDGKVYHTSTVYDFSGTIIETYAPSGESPNVAAGWDYALGKYNGPKGGLVLFHLGGAAVTLPKYPADFWTTNPTKYALSHVVLFRVEPTTTVPDGGATLLLLGLSFAGIGAVRRAMVRKP